MVHVSRRYGDVDRCRQTEVVIEDTALVGASAFLDMIRENTAEWKQRAACHGMGSEFTSRSHQDQQKICKPCPVKQECLDDLYARVRKYGWREVVDGDLVCGGLAPPQLRTTLYRRRTLEKSQEGGVQAEADALE